MLSRTKIILVLIVSYDWSRLNGVLEILTFVDHSLSLIISFLDHQPLLILTTLILVASCRKLLNPCLSTWGWPSGLDQLEKMKYPIFYIHMEPYIVGKLGYISHRVVSHLFTGSLAGIGKLPALASWYVYLVWYVQYFLYCKIWRELHFATFCGNSPQKGGLVHQKWGRSEEKEVPAKCMIPKRTNQVFLWYRLGKYQENTIPTDTKPKYRIGMQLLYLSF